MSRTYKTMQIKEIVERLRKGDYVDEHRTADIIVSLVAALDAARILAHQVMETGGQNHDDIRNALLYFALKTSELNEIK